MNRTLQVGSPPVFGERLAASLSKADAAPVVPLDAPVRHIQRSATYTIDHGEMKGFNPSRLGDGD
jgi:hypothetical protein